MSTQLQLSEYVNNSYYIRQLLIPGGRSGAGKQQAGRGGGGVLPCPTTGPGQVGLSRIYKALRNKDI